MRIDASRFLYIYLLGAGMEPVLQAYLPIYP